MDNNRIQEELSAIALREDGLIESVSRAFRNALNRIVQRAQARVIADLREQLVVTDGAVDPTPANLRKLRAIDRIFMSYMNQFGYQELLNTIVKQFDKQIPLLEEIIDALRRSSGETIRKLGFVGRDLRAFSALRLSARTTIGTVVEAAGAAAMRQALLSISGLSFRELADELAERLSISVENAESTAATAMATYYRTISARAFETIQDDLPTKVLKYRYYGPLDFKTRRFCRSLLRAGEAYTRKQIDAMDNGNLPNVFTTCGGWNCRHQWIMNI